MSNFATCFVIYAMYVACEIVEQHTRVNNLIDSTEAEQSGIHFNLLVIFVPCGNFTKFTT